MQRIEASIPVYEATQLSTSVITLAENSSACPLTFYCFNALMFSASQRMCIRDALC